MHLSVIVPAYNEEKIIADTISRLSAYFRKKPFEAEIIVVDDGSRDRTVGVADAAAKGHANVRVLRSPKNQGKGGACRIGALAAKGEWRLFLDADLSTLPEEYEKFVPYMGTHEVIIGSRCLPDSVITVRQPFFREIVGRMLNLVFRIVMGLPFADTQCGFKLYHERTRAVFEEQRVTGWMFEVETLFLARKKGFKIKEVPIVWAHDASSSVKLSDFFGIIRDLIKIRKMHGS